MTEEVKQPEPQQTEKPRPVYCHWCDEDSAEYVKDVDIFEVYECPRCENQRWIPVR